MELLPTTSLQTAIEKIPFFLHFPAFSQLIIFFVFLQFTLSSFDSSAPFEDYSFDFRPLGKPSNNGRPSV